VVVDGPGLTVLPTCDDTYTISWALGRRWTTFKWPDEGAVLSAGSDHPKWMP
jgi:hypothetical protein